jgi:phosphopantothenoylcysteine decarboxylase/phosphopantothenate--cysteine ligase
MTRQNIILGVTGGIAAYKAPELVRRLRERDASVQVVMTGSAQQFVTETALQAVSGLPVRRSLWDREAEAAMSHIELARWADLVLVAPATAEFMSRIATGAAPDLLTTLCLATRAPIIIAPAMNHVMWDNPAVQANREVLEARGITLLGPEDGDQACGETGVGRMMEPGDIVAAIQPTVPVSNTDNMQSHLQGKTVMVTAGPTREAIDPVRYITNRSSGKMGYAIANAARDAGAKVVLISGPVSLDEPDGVECVQVETAEQMFAATHEHIESVDIFIAAAAVSDYRPEKQEQNKIKKTKSVMQLDLVKSPDTLASVAKLANGPFTVGFAAETERVRDYALGKLENKKLDMIVANRVGADRGFDREDNAVEAFWRGGEQSFPMAAKSELATQLIQLIAERYDRRSDTRPGKEWPRAVRD